MEITYKNRVPTIRSVKHVERGNFPMILYRIQRICCVGDTVKIWCNSPTATITNSNYHQQQLSPTATTVLFLLVSKLQDEKLWN